MTEKEKRIARWKRRQKRKRRAARCRFFERQLNMLMGYSQMRMNNWDITFDEEEVNSDGFDIDYDEPTFVVELSESSDEEELPLRASMMKSVAEMSILDILEKANREFNSKQEQENRFKDLLGDIRQRKMPVFSVPDPSVMSVLPGVAEEHPEKLAADEFLHQQELEIKRKVEVKKKFKRTARRASVFLPQRGSNKPNKGRRVSIIDQIPSLNMPEVATGKFSKEINAYQSGILAEHQAMMKQQQRVEQEINERKDMEKRVMEQVKEAKAEAKMMKKKADQEKARKDELRKKRHLNRQRRAIRR
jgi:hypothetical protein